MHIPLKCDLATPPIKKGNLKYSTNEPIYKTETHRHRDQTCSCQGGGREGEGWTGNLGLVDANYYI